MDPQYFIMGVAGVLVCLVIAWSLLYRRSRKPSSAPFDPGQPARLKPMLSQAQIGFYNLLRMAVGDRYLIFAQVPLWCLVDVAMPDTGARVPLLSQLALKRAAFVLIHPGTRQAEKVIDWKGENGTDADSERPDPLLATVLEPAGVEVVVVSARRSYAVADLVTLLDGPDTEA